jgi:peroxin-4
MNSRCYKRLKKEAQSLKRDSDEFVKLSVSPDSLKEWNAKICGPPGSAYEGFEFDLKIEVGENYPLLPPKLTFETKIFHPNVHFDSGEICLDILKKEWSPAWTLASACRAVVALLASPEPER